MYSINKSYSTCSTSHNYRFCSCFISAYINYTF